MSLMKTAIAVLLAGVLLSGCNGEKQNGGDGGPDPWEPPHVYQDVPFVQEVGVVAGALTDVRAVALGPDEVCHVATASGVMKWDQGAWQSVATPVTGEVIDIAFDGSGTLGVAGPSGAAAGSQSITLPADAAPAFIAPRAAGGWWVGGDDFAGYWDGSYNSIFESINQPVRDVCDLPDGTWFAATPQGVFTPAGSVTTADGLPSDDVRAVEAAPDGTVWAGTDAGMARRDAGAWTAFVGEDGLHYGDILDITFDADGVMLVSTYMGASRFHPDGSRRYYLGRIWLPDNQVRGMARTQDGTIWLATAGGVSRVEQQMMTLEEKAALFDQITQQRHVRLGYTVMDNRLEVAGDLTTFTNIDDDNDGQWTSQYLASQCFRYATTGEPEARENARVAAYALMFLEEVTPIEGFFARSIVPPEECEAKQQSGSGEWHLSDDGAWCWKGDTSSDEFVGHMFGLSIFYDLVANEEEKEDVARTVGRIVGYIVDNGYQLLDIDGEVTTHGQFNPEWMESDPGARFGDSGLNSAMILGALRSAYRMTGEKRFVESFDFLARKRHYEDYVSCIEETNLAWHTNHDSEEMSFLAMYTLVRQEEDPILLEKWRNGDPELECEGLQHLWEVQRPERNPEFNMIYAPLAQKDEYDLEESIETLKYLPVNLILWGQDHSQRWDRDEDPNLDRHGHAQNKFVFPYNERQAMRWAENPYAYVLRGDGHSESSGTFWLLPYWMGRYYGVIE